MKIQARNLGKQNKIVMLLDAPINQLAHFSIDSTTDVG